jgi:hypothetical protein
MGNELPFRGYDLRVLQASGMVSVQAECTVAEALTRMNSRAEATDQTMERLADAILDRSLQFRAL